VRCWEDEVFLFNSHTGNTHILNKLAWRLLSACSEEPQSEQVLFEMLVADFGGQNQEELAEALDDHLDQLQQLGLAEPREDYETR